MLIVNILKYMKKMRYHSYCDSLLLQVKQMSFIKCLGLKVCFQSFLLIYWNKNIYHKIHNTYRLVKIGIVLPFEYGGVSSKSPGSLSLHGVDGVGEGLGEHDDEFDDIDEDRTGDPGDTGEVVPPVAPS